MFENRIQAFLVAPAAVPAFAAFQPAFVPCPLPLFGAFTFAQQAFVVEVYRVAQELTQSQLRKPRRRRIPQFSRN